MFTNNINGKELTISNFKPGQKILYQVCEPPYEHVKTYRGVVKTVYDDYLIADIPKISDHCRFEEGFNLQFLYPEPLSDNELLGLEVWTKFYKNPTSTREDEDRMISEIADELDNCGESIFLIRQVLSDLVTSVDDIYLYKGDVTEQAWREIADSLLVDPELLKDNICIRGRLIDGCLENKDQ